jgi:hypothetical protein
MAVESMRVIMDGMLERLPADLSGSELGEVFDLLFYRTDDMGDDLVRVLREWVDSDDLRRVEAALSLSVAFLFNSREELTAHLTPVAKRWPQTAGKVEEILRVWDKQSAQLG